MIIYPSIHGIIGAMVKCAPFSTTSCGDPAQQRPRGVTGDHC